MHFRLIQYLYHKHEERWDSASACTGFKVWLADKELCAGRVDHRLCFHIFRFILYCWFDDAGSVTKLLLTPTMVFCRWLIPCHLIRYQIRQNIKKLRCADCAGGRLVETGNWRELPVERLQTRGFRLLYWLPMKDELSLDNVQGTRSVFHLIQFEVMKQQNCSCKNAELLILCKHEHWTTMPFL